MLHPLPSNYLSTVVIAPNVGRLLRTQACRRQFENSRSFLHICTGLVVGSSCVLPLPRYPQSVQPGEGVHEIAERIQVLAAIVSWSPTSLDVAGSLACWLAKNHGFTPSERSHRFIQKKRRHKVLLKGLLAPAAGQGIGYLAVRIFNSAKFLLYLPRDPTLRGLTLHPPAFKPHLHSHHKSIVL